MSPADGASAEPHPSIPDFDPPASYTREIYLALFRSGRYSAPWRFATVYHRTGLYFALAGTRDRAWDYAYGACDLDAMRCLAALAVDPLDTAAEHEAGAAERAEHERRQRRAAAGELAGGAWAPPRRTLQRLTRAGRRAERAAALAAAVEARAAARRAVTDANPRRAIHPTQRGAAAAGMVRAPARIRCGAARGRVRFGAVARAPMDRSAGATMIAALFVDPRGPYVGLPDVDLWTIDRDARAYDGPHPVVAHPPCERWGRFWWADGSTAPGNDGGCFAAALASVRRFGGVIEHPQGSHAWRAFGLPAAVLGAWAPGAGGWSTCVAQQYYGHPAVKFTWLFYVGPVEPPALDWRKPGKPTKYLAQPGRCSRAKPRPTCGCERCRLLYGAAWRGEGKARVPRLSPRENAATPPAFRDLLLALARLSAR